MTNQADRPSLSVAILSGKGGVGKTTIALNLARILSESQHVWLLDFDLFNRGATAALWETDAGMPLTVAELIEGCKGMGTAGVEWVSGYLRREIAAKKDALAYDESLFFLPAARAKEGRKASALLWEGVGSEYLPATEFLSALLRAIQSADPGAAVVIDGHGGLDELSVAAAGLATVTYIVNEPDLITFTGSVTLYREIRDQFRDANHEPWMEFIINRVPPSRGIKRITRDFGGPLSTMSSSATPVAAYFPLEKELFAVFGDDPFAAEIYTRYWFSKKIHYLAGELHASAKARGVAIENPAPRKPKSFRTGLRRPFHQQGDLVLMLWLGTIGVGSMVGTLLGMLFGASVDTTLFLSFLFYPLAVIQTVRWIRVQRAHYRNSKRLRQDRKRRLRLGESRSAMLRDTREKTVATGTLRRVLYAGSIVFVVVGILAAIAIPNILTAMHRSRQKISMADLRTIATALEALATDINDYPPRPASGLAKDLAPVLMPTYIRRMPTTNAWQHEVRYYRWATEKGYPSYAFVDPARDGIFEHDDIGGYVEGTTTSFDNDIVYSDGKFIRYPEGVASSGQ